MRLLKSSLSLWLLLLAQPIWAVAVTPHEQSQCRRWVAARFEAIKGQVKDRPRLAESSLGPTTATLASDPPFSFKYNGQYSTQFLAGWTARRQTKQLDGQRVKHSLTYVAPSGELTVRCEAIAYLDFPAVEWTVYFKNTGSSDTKLLTEVRGLDLTLIRESAAEYLLHYWEGCSSLRATDYQPLQKILQPSQSLMLHSVDGLPCTENLPYFNLEQPASGGVMLAVGWPGKWASWFTRDGGKNLRIAAGQEITQFMLRAGEEVRTPLMAILFYDGPWVRGQNLWRGWMLRHNLPQRAGKPLQPQFSGSSLLYTGYMQNGTEENQKQWIDRYVAERIKPDNWWMDAGWYLYEGNWVSAVAWTADPKRFPHGLRAINDYAHARGIRSIVWFEPERVAKISNNYLMKNHPDWLLNASGQTRAVLNLGHPAALRWAIDYFSDEIAREGIDVFRMDSNGGGMLAYWQAGEASNRQGITENKNVQGYLAFWDGLLRRNPGLVIDSCASGGTRNDLESARRSLPYWIDDSDYFNDDNSIKPIPIQSHSYCIASILPLFGTFTGSSDPYLLRSCMAPLLTGVWNMQNNALNYQTIRNHVAQWRQISGYYSGDYYPLGGFSLANNVWLAWQYDRPDLGQGVVQAFRREQSTATSTTYQLQGLVPGKQYVIRNFDTATTSTMTGQALMEQGLPVTIPQMPGAAIISYSANP